MILLIDNYDSFTYNVKQEIEILGFQCLVARNDEISIQQIKALNPEKIVISPGPGRPEAAGITMDVLSEFSGRTPVLGICLGHQAIGAFHGIPVIHAKVPMHGKISNVIHQGKGVFHSLKNPLAVARYHSLIVQHPSVSPWKNDSLEITAQTEEGEIMGLRNVLLKQEGVQFHPESVATEYGRLMMKNFLERVE